MHFQFGDFQHPLIRKCNFTTFKEFDFFSPSGREVLHL